MESTSSAASGGNHHHHPRLPPGFRFHPTDEELVVHYLKKRAASAPLPAAIIADLDLYKYDPWELPSKASFGEQEWYFFSRRERKYPNGERPNRSATSGYWKATGTDKPVVTGNGTQTVGVKKALVFYGGKAPKGTKTNWIMHEYRLANTNSATRKPPGFGNKNPSRLDDWVLCRIFKKSKEEENMPIPMATPSVLGGGYDHRSSIVIPAGDPLSMPPLMETSRPEYVENVFSPQYNWNGNGKGIRWGEEEDDSSRSTRDDDGSVSFISLLNQQFPQTLMHQHLHHHSTGEAHGILDPSSQLPTTSYFH